MTCETLLFLAMSIFRRVIFSRYPYGNYLHLPKFLFLGVGLLFLACIFLAGLYLAGARVSVKVLVCRGGVVFRFFFG